MLASLVGEVGQMAGDRSTLEDGREEQTAPCYRLEEVEGKGRALVASRDLAVGTLVLSDTPWVITLFFLLNLYFKRYFSKTRHTAPTALAPAPAAPARGAPPPACGAPSPACGVSPPARGALPPARGAPPPARGAPPPARGNPPPACVAPPPTRGAPPTARGAPPPAPVPLAPARGAPQVVSPPTRAKAQCLQCCKRLEAGGHLC